jgi:hypothetical protein
MRRFNGWPPGARPAGSAVLAGVLLITIAGSASAAPELKAPLVTIQRVQGKGIVFVPAKVRDPVVSAANCSDTDFSVMIQNGSNKTLTITFQGQPFGTLTSGEEFTSCQEGAGRVVFKLKGHPNARLIINAVVPGS